MGPRLHLPVSDKSFGPTRAWLNPKNSDQSHNPRGGAPLRSRLLAVLFFVLSSLSVAHAEDPSTVKIGVLKFGTVSWLLDTIQANGLDKAEGIELDITPLASTQATTLGLQSNSLDLAVTDWLWVSRERTNGADFTFVPFSTALGAIMVPPDSRIKTLADLKGKTLGVAGGPLDKSWLLIVAYALRTANVDLRTDTTQEFGAPPLLTARAREGEIDAVLNFWPYAARLEAAGFTQLIGLEDVARELGAKGEVAMVGYVFDETWAQKNPKAINGFLRAAAKANELLATSDAEWDRLKPLMGAKDPSFTEKTFEALRRRYREGIPERPIASEEIDAKVLYQFLRELGGTKLVGSGTELAPGTFWHGAKQ
jgi:NitT/TauT family transport system substrate-binding protein